jgi:hypothetical protein
MSEGSLPSGCSLNVGTAPAFLHSISIHGLLGLPAVIDACEQDANGTLMAAPGPRFHGIPAWPRVGARCDAVTGG